MVEVTPTTYALRRYGARFCERFWERVNTDGVCWEWTGAATKLGYCQVAVAGGRWVASVHRASWEILVGEIGTGLQIDHRCYNTRCVNPDHLEPVTPQVNSDRARRMRAGRLAELRKGLQPNPLPPFPFRR